jgi:hypothetical protein
MTAMELGTKMMGRFYELAGGVIERGSRGIKLYACPATSRRK